jgi:hypothetical protein
MTRDQRRRPWYRSYLPGWIVSGGGGGGLSTVTTDATLTGAGTVASPLKVANPFPSGWPLTWYASRPGGGSIQQIFGQNVNTLVLYGIYIEAQVRFGHIVLDIQTADAVNNCDVGFYNIGGTLAAHIGAQTIPSTGIQSFSVSGGAVTLNPGRYYWASTSTTATAGYRVSDQQHNNWTFILNNNFGASAGGALPASITPPADAIQNEYTPHFALTT